MKLKHLVYCFFVGFLLVSLLHQKKCWIVTGTKKMPTYEQGSYQLYKLRVNDELMICVITTDKVLSDLFPSSSGSSANRMSYRVFAEDGMVEFPFLEPVKLEGLTLEEAEQLVTEKMRSFCVRHSSTFGVVHKYVLCDWCCRSWLFHNI